MSANCQEASLSGYGCAVKATVWSVLGGGSTAVKLMGDMYQGDGLGWWWRCDRGLREGSAISEL